MKDHEFLMDAIGQIDEDLILEAAHPLKKWTPARVIIYAVAACLVMAVGCSFFLRQPSPQNHSNELKYAENLWERDSFAAYSLFYRTGTASLLSQHTAAPLSETLPDTVTSKTLSISPDKTIRFETLVAQRYAVYYSSTGYPIFYDTQEDREVDLQERILGDTNSIFMKHMEAAEAKANELSPGMLRSETNRRLFWEYSYYISRDLPAEEVVAQTPDTSFMDYLDEWKYTSDEDRVNVFWSLCWQAYAQAETNLYNQLYSINILGIDTAGGLCILKAQDFYGNGCAYLVYDIKTDTYQELPDGDSLIGTMQKDGYIFRFSSDSSIATIAFPDAGFSGGNLHLDITQRFTVPSSERYVSNYRGEQLGVFFLNNGRAERLMDARGASELFISKDNKVLYYKQMESALSGKTFHASDAVWFNRLTLYNRDTDHWVFHTVTNGTDVIASPITLQGNFIRFAAEETIVIMERGGSYYAYSMESGRDITEDVKAGQISMYAHELMTVYLENGKLYRRNVFQNTPAEVICEAERFILSEDQAFVFSYRTGDNHVTCFNIATLENCRIDMEPQMCAQLFSTEGSVLQMNYNEEENTLLLSYYLETDLNTENSSEVDFYGLLEELNDQNPDTHFPEDPTVITDMTVTEEVMDAFRDSAYRYLHPDGVITWEKYYPSFLSLYEDRYSIFQKLGLPQPETELSVNGTQFILYEDEDERLTLTFYSFWELFDYNDHNAGFEIRYHGSGTCYFTFNALALAPSEPEPPTKIELPFEIPPAPEPELSVMMPPVTIPGEPIPEDKLEQSYGPELFDTEISAGQPQPLSKDTRDRIMAEVEDLLSRKYYTPEGNRLIRDTVEQLCYTYSSFQTLFALANVPDAETYILEAVLDCLDQKVDTVCYPCNHSKILNPNIPGGRGQEHSRAIHVSFSTDASINAAMFLKGLSEIRAEYGNYSFTQLTNGYQKISMLTMMNSNYYHQFSNIYSVAYQFSDPDNQEHYLQYGQFMSCYDSFYAGIYFRLLSLTDYETMEKAMQPDGREMLRNELVRRYGTQGGQLYDGLMDLEPYGQRFNAVIKTEALFLKLFTRRLDEIQTKEDMVSYLQMYRFYRQMLCVQYIHEYNVDVAGCLERRTLELAHPKLDYDTADMAVAQAAVNHGIFNDEAVPAELQLMLAHGLVSRRKAFDYIDNRENVNALSRDCFVLLRSRIQFQTQANGIVSFFIHCYPNSRVAFAYDVDGMYPY